MIAIILVACKISQVNIALWVGAITGSIPLHYTT